MYHIIYDLGELGTGFIKLVAFLGKLLDIVIIKTPFPGNLIIICIILLFKDPITNLFLVGAGLWMTFTMALLALKLIGVAMILFGGFFLLKDLKTLKRFLRGRKRPSDNN